MASRNSKGTGRGEDHITRRDFLHDVGLAGAGVAVAPALAAAVTGGGYPADGAPSYPPTRTGLRGSHPGAFEAAHGLAREGQSPGAAEALPEHYDLVVVGAGISGLAAAYFYRQHYGLDARILLLDNHDDFGGHAKRNEFHQGGTMQLAWGGTVNIEYWKYSEVGNRLLRELGVDIERLLGDFRFNWGDNGTGLASGTWFDRESYGRDALVKGFSLQDFSCDALRAAAPDMPLSRESRDALLRFAELDREVLVDRSDAERERYARTTSYAVFLAEHGGLPAEAIAIFDKAMLGIWGVRTPDLSVAECFESGLPGAHILKLPAQEGEESASAMFPDGNASIARLLVRALIPSAFPAMDADDDPFSIVTALLAYSRLDRPGQRVRLRLNSTVLRVAHKNGSDDGDVVLSYARDGRLYSVTAGQCVLACYNRIIPHICPSLPEAQKRGLSECIKRPMGTVNVVLRNGRAIEKSGLASAYLPGSLLQLVTLNTGVDAGPYQTRWDPEAPCQLHFFFGVPPENPAGLDIVAQSRAGRLRLLAMDFDDFERELRRVLAGIWGPSGLDVDTDILAITVNRWPHGYARDLIDLEDPAWLATPGPYEIGRQRFGRIAIANSDAGADAYTHTAIDQAWRAVRDLASEAS